MVEPRHVQGGKRAEHGQEPVDTERLSEQIAKSQKGVARTLKVPVWMDEPRRRDARLGVALQIPHAGRERSRRRYGIGINECVELRSPRAQYLVVSACKTDVAQICNQANSRKLTTNEIGAAVRGGVVDDVDVSLYALLSFESRKALREIGGRIVTHHNYGAARRVGHDSGQWGVMRESDGTRESWTGSIPSLRRSRFFRRSWRRITSPE